VLLRLKVMKDFFVNRVVKNIEGVSLYSVILGIAILIALVALVPAINTWVTSVFNTLTGHTDAQIQEVINP